MKLKVIKDCYYISREDFGDIEYLSHEELMNRLVHMLVKGDIWETSTEHPELLVCTSSETPGWKGEYNEGFWEYEDLKDYFEEID